MSGPGERRRVVDLYSATPMAAARVAERLGYPTGQCLECRPAKDPGYAGHMARPIVPLETGAKACVCSIESGPCERVDVFHVSGRFWSTSACGEKRTPARPAWTSFPS